MRIFLFVVFLALPALAMAQMPLAKKKEPVQIEASKQMDWLRAQNKYTATGDVVITQGTTIIHGDTAEAVYDAAQGPSALQTVTISGHVVITDTDKKILAESGTYDIVNQILHLRGKTVTLSGTDLQVTASDGIDYFVGDAQANTPSKAVSIGPAEVVQKGETLRAKQLTAWFDKGNKLQRAHAVGNVVIIRALPNANQDGGTKDIIQGNMGDYDVAKNNATLTSNVKLTRGTSHMEGDFATINLQTGAASLHNTATANGASGGRVRAIFTPADSKPLPSVTASLPIVQAKKEFEPAYSVNR